jgi:quercetin dioxygenase-like cupin family protein
VKQRKQSGLPSAVALDPLVKIRFDENEGGRTSARLPNQKEIIIMKKLIAVVVVSILAMVVAKAQDPAKVDPQHYKVLLNNEYVRILDVRQQPGAKSPMHSHPHHAVYWLTGSTLKFTSSDGKTKTVTTTPGQVAWRNPETHTVEIVGKTASHALDIELKK